MATTEDKHAAASPDIIKGLASQAMEAFDYDPRSALSGLVIAVGIIMGRHWEPEDWETMLDNSKPSILGAAAVAAKAAGNG